MYLRYSENNKSIRHVLQYRDPSTNDYQDNGIVELSQWIKNSLHILTLAKGIGYHLYKWRYSDSIRLTSNVSLIVQEILDAQNIIGWDKVLFGILHRLWRYKIGRYLKELERKESGIGQISLLICKLLELQHCIQIYYNKWFHDKHQEIQCKEKQAMITAI